jgi:hypothetical protein
MLIFLTILMVLILVNLLITYLSLFCSSFVIRRSACLFGTLKSASACPPSVLRCASCLVSESPRTGRRVGLPVVDWGGRLARKRTDWARWAFSCCTRAQVWSRGLVALGPLLTWSNFYFLIWVGGFSRGPSIKAICYTTGWARPATGSSVTLGGRRLYKRAILLSLATQP